jgi:hypothetical protein
VKVERNYRGFRLEVSALPAGKGWNAEVRIRRTLSDMKTHIEIVTCRKPTATAAEEHAVIYARRWVDRYRSA